MDESVKYRVVSQSEYGHKDKSRALSAADAIMEIKRWLDVGRLIIRVEIVK